MSLDFFKDDCQEPPINHALFGLCDDEKNKAYTSITEPEKWIATVRNDSQITLTFIAVDNCVIKRNEYHERGRCDCMLTSPNHIYFVELKNERKGWITDAIEQVESTIQFFRDSHDINLYKHKKAFVCNKSHKPFQVIDNEVNLRFFREYKVRLDIQAEIIIV